MQNKATSTDDLLAEDQGAQETQELFSQDQISTPLLTAADDDTASVESGSSTSLETVYEEDPDVPEGVIPQSQPCYKRGIHYTPLGLRRVYIKKRKLENDYDPAAVTTDDHDVDINSDEN